MRLTPKHEVDKYLNEEVEDYFEEVEFDILAWWKINCHKYPVLAAVARDALAVQVSTMASESVFSTGGRIIDSKRSSLTPKTAESLICLQNWLRGDYLIPTTEDDEPSIKWLSFMRVVNQRCRRQHRASFLLHDYSSNIVLMQRCGAFLYNCRGNAFCCGQPLRMYNKFVSS